MIGTTSKKVRVNRTRHNRNVQNRGVKFWHQIGSDWPQMGQTWDFLRSFSVHFGFWGQCDPI